jgi:uncharacterized protein (TIGR00730 family)
VEKHIERMISHPYVLSLPAEQINTMQSIAVYCGSNLGIDPVYREKAIELGKLLASNQITLIYGGARIGMMGAIAEAALSAGGNVIGVIPDFLKIKEVAHEGLTEMITVKSMHERKTIMYEKADGLIAMPGGFGTMEELFEMLTWAQLGLHSKPIGLLNAGGFYHPLIEMVEKMVQQAYLKQVYRDMLLVSGHPVLLLEKMSTYQAPKVSKWISPDKL